MTKEVSAKIKRVRAGKEELIKRGRRAINQAQDMVLLYESLNRCASIWFTNDGIVRVLAPAALSRPCVFCVW